MEVLIIIALILLNGLLSMSEIALVSARKSRLESDAKKGNKRAATALRLAGDPDRFLSTIQIGITLIGILTGFFSGEVFAEDLAKYVAMIEPLKGYALGISEVIIVLVVTYLTLIFGELVPKRIGMGAAEKVSKIVAKPMYILSKIGAPFVCVLSWSTSFVVKIFGLKFKKSAGVTEEEIKAIIQEGTDGGEIQQVEQDIVERVFNLSDRNVGSIMTHRSELVWLDVNDPTETIVAKIKQDTYSIYPVADGKLDNILGVAFLKDVFGCYGNDDFSLRDIVLPAEFMPEQISAYNALDRLKRSGVQYGLVTDEFGSVEGMVTLKDVLTALVGEMYETGEEPDIVPREDNSWFVDGQISFYDFLAHFDMEHLYNDNEYNTLSGLILALLERVPRVGEKFTWSVFEFEVVDMDIARIDKLLVRRIG